MMIVSSWMMIDAVTYGPTPSMATEKFLSPPPAKMLNNPNSWLLFRTEDKPRKIYKRDRDMRKDSGNQKQKHNDDFVPKFFDFPNL
jgi:hypothetical protein